MNSVVLIGNLARDPEIRYTQTQLAVCSFTLAVNRQRTRNNENPGADFIRINTFGKLAENCSKYLQKGRKAAVKGRIQTGSYTDKEGQKIYTTDVMAETVEFIGAPLQNNGQQRNQQANNPPMQQEQIPDDDIPEGFAYVDEDDVPF